MNKTQDTGLTNLFSRITEKLFFICVDHFHMKDNMSQRSVECSCIGTHRDQDCIDLSKNESFVVVIATENYRGHD
jgi:hypothetical protein